MGKTASKLKSRRSQSQCRTPVCRSRGARVPFLLPDEAPKSCFPALFLAAPPRSRASDGPGACSRTRDLKYVLRVCFISFAVSLRHATLSASRISGGTYAHFARPLSTPRRPLQGQREIAEKFCYVNPRRAYLSRKRTRSAARDHYSNERRRRRERERERERLLTCDEPLTSYFFFSSSPSGFNDEEEGKASMRDREAFLSSSDAYNRARARKIRANSIIRSVLI